ncbi:MAG: M20 family metallopeptidase [Ramlibacter sp.]|nr:M20 family metallopeptidase [Ramlibacter sp.]
MNSPSASARQQLSASLADYFDGHGFESDLARRVAWQTESDTGSPTPELEAYLTRELTPALERMGFDCLVATNPDSRGGSLLIARRIEDPALPTVLTYGHGDVVNGQADRWREGLNPWRLETEGPRWYGRGTADNKGQHTINLAALEHTLAARGGALGYNVTVLIEMGEEAGSPGLRPFCERHRNTLGADLLIACDGPRVAADRPTLFLGARGALNFSLRVQCREQGYHSGNWGGVLANPAIVLAHAMASLVDEKGRIKVAAWRPDALPLKVRELLRGVPAGGGPDDPAIDPSWGEPGLTPIEKLVGWNTLEVLAMEAGSPRRPVNAIPPSAVAHCQLRFVVDTPWENARDVLRSHLDAAGFPMVEIEVTARSSATRLDLSSPWIDWACRSMEKSAGKPVCVLPNLAGSLPNDVFAGLLGLPTLWVPHSYPACAQHAPNEHLLAPVAREGLQIMGGLYWDLGEPGGPPWRHSPITP